MLVEGALHRRRAGQCIQQKAFIVPALPARCCLSIGDHDQWVPGSVD